ncbi:MAG: DUF1801 domain-containing protein [Bacteroidetes bacterium]|nr:DUF1801 domain-containing protein [Bacteroidota bacterium]
MRSNASTPEEYIESLPADRKKVFAELRNAFRKNLPEGYKESMAYGMITYCIPLSTYPKGYHVSPGTPLGLVSIASQKNFLAVYHMGLYMDSKLLKWFRDEYKKQSKGKLDMGKSCVRLKKLDDIPFKLFADLAKKITVETYIEKYERVLKKIGKL